MSDANGLKFDKDEKEEMLKALAENFKKYTAGSPEFYKGIKLILKIKEYNPPV